MRRVDKPEAVTEVGDFFWEDKREGYHVPEEIDAVMLTFLPNDYAPRPLPVTLNRDGVVGWRWDGNRDRPTLWPSVRPMTPEGEEVWHGYIDAGEFREV